MGSTDFNDLRRHLGHKIVCVAYGEVDNDWDNSNNAGEGRLTDIYNVAIECETCNEVLLDYDKGQATLEDENDTITIAWSVDDVRDQLASREENRGEKYALSTTDLQTILERVERSHDATIGINWDVIDTAIDHYLSEHPEKINKEG